MAVLVDGGFFLKRYDKLYPGAQGHGPEIIANNIWKAGIRHVSPEFDLNRIFYYDCLPIGKKIHNPISKKGIDFILHPLWNPVDQNLFEHVDGLRSTSPKPC